MSLTGNSTAGIGTRFSKDPGSTTPTRNANDPLGQKYSNTQAWAEGAAAGQAEQQFADSRTLTTGSAEELDLSGGLTNAFGDTVTLTAVKAIYVKNNSTTNHLLFGGAAANPWIGWTTVAASKIEIQPGGVLYMEAQDADGMAVVAATGDLLRFEHAADDATDIVYDLAILGKTS